MLNTRLSVRFVGIALVMGAVVALSACGTSPTEPKIASPPPPPASVKTVVMEGSIASLPVDYVAGQYFSTTAAGTIDVTVDWTFTENTIYVWLAKGKCTFEQFDAGACEYATTSFASRPKPRVLSVPGAAAGTYTLIIGNLGPRDEATSYQVVLTSASAASTSAHGSKSSGQAPRFLGRIPTR